MKGETVAQVRQDAGPDQNSIGQGHCSIIITANPICQSLDISAEPCTRLADNGQLVENGNKGCVEGTRAAFKEQELRLKHIRSLVFAKLENLIEWVKVDANGECSMLCLNFHSLPACCFLVAVNSSEVLLNFF